MRKKTSKQNDGEKITKPRRSQRGKRVNKVPTIVDLSGGETTPFYSADFSTDVTGPAYQANQHLIRLCFDICKSKREQLKDLKAMYEGNQ